MVLWLNQFGSTNLSNDWNEARVHFFVADFLGFTIINKLNQATKTTIFNQHLFKGCGFCWQYWRLLFIPYCS